jgi:hypothetical protein
MLSVKILLSTANLQIISLLQVHFAQDTSLLTVHRENSWPLDAYADARKGPWQEIARDHQRFANRILKVEKAIEHCLTPTHRSRMYGMLHGSAT